MVNDSPSTPSKYAKVLAITNFKLPIKLDPDKLNYSNWSDFTISDSLVKCVLKVKLKTAREAWEFLEKIFKDNKRLKMIELMCELRSLDIIDLIVKAYFWKIDYIASRLDNLGSNMSKDELVTYSIHGLSDKYDQVAHVILNREPFLDLEIVRFMVSLAESRPNRRQQHLHNTDWDSTQASTLPQAYSNLTLEEFNNEGWNMDTGVHPIADLVLLLLSAFSLYCDSSRMFLSHMVFMPSGDFGFMLVRSNFSTTYSDIDPHLAALKQILLNVWGTVDHGLQLYALSPFYLLVIRMRISLGLEVTIGASLPIVYCDNVTCGSFLLIHAYQKAIDAYKFDISTLFEIELRPHAFRPQTPSTNSNGLLAAIWGPNYSISEDSEDEPIEVEHFKGLKEEGLLKSQRRRSTQISCGRVRFGDVCNPDKDGCMVKELFS
ncbi:hypothetical protein Tco_0745223 [Tanacetum coccineum]